MKPNGRNHSAPAFYDRNGAPVVSVDNCLKMWITRQGEVIPLPGFHREYIAVHHKELGVRITRTGDGLRLDAIAAGLFRGNFNHADGCLTFEGQRRHLTPIMKQALWNLVVNNFDYLGSITIALFSAKNDLLASKTVNLTQLPTRRACLAAIPYLQPAKVNPVRNKIK